MIPERQIFAQIRSWLDSANDPLNSENLYENSLLDMQLSSSEIDSMVQFYRQNPINLSHYFPVHGKVEFPLWLLVRSNKNIIEEYMGTGEDTNRKKAQTVITASTLARTPDLTLLSSELLASVLMQQEEELLDCFELLEFSQGPLHLDDSYENEKLFRLNTEITVEYDVVATKRNLVELNLDLSCLFHQDPNDPDLQKGNVSVC